MKLTELNSTPEACGQLLAELIYKKSHGHYGGVSEILKGLDLRAYAFTGAESYEEIDEMASDAVNEMHSDACANAQHRRDTQFDHFEQELS